MEVQKKSLFLRKQRKKVRKIDLITLKQKRGRKGEESTRWAGGSTAVCRVSSFQKREQRE